MAVVEQFMCPDCQKHNVYCSIIIVGPSEEVKSQVQGSHEYELLNLPKRQRAKCKVNILEMPSARFIGERVVGAASL